MILETFKNSNPRRDYRIQFETDAFTSLCPITRPPGVVTFLYRNGQIRTGAGGWEKAWRTKVQVKVVNEISPGFHTLILPGVIDDVRPE